MERLFIVVPVFNEEPNIPALFRGFAQLAEELAERLSIQYVLVDDASSDATAETARREAGALDLVVLAHEANRGPGAAFATAFEWLAPRLGERDWVITMEGDNTSRHQLIRQMFTRAGEGFDVVLASPYMYGGGFTQTSFMRKLLSSGANLVVKDLLDIQGILTVSSFFRLYRGQALHRLQAAFGPGIVERAGFESMVEMVMKMALLRLGISEVAMQLDSSLRKGKSKMKVMRTIVGYLALWRCKPRWAAQMRDSQGESSLLQR
ncbi:MAG: glycosyltransferase family 2 protein [Usitatibacter sp.]